MRRIFLAAIAVTAVAAGLVASPSFASSPDAWDALYKTTAQACLKKSGLKKPRVVDGPVLFSGAVLYQVRGIWPQAHMKGKTGKVYCLHPYPNGAPEISEGAAINK